MVVTNRNCCWHGQPDPSAWKKPTVEGCAGWARKPRYDDMRTSQSAMDALMAKLVHVPATHGILLPRSVMTAEAEMEALADAVQGIVLPAASEEAWHSDMVCRNCLDKGLEKLDDKEPARVGVRG